MSIYDTLRLLAATGCGIQIGGFLLLSLFHKPLFADWPNDLSLLSIYKRFYRFNLIVALLSGILAVFAEARLAGMYLAILGTSNVLLQTHLLPAIVHCRENSKSKTTARYRRPVHEMLEILKKLQVTAHFLQLLFIFFIIYKLID